MWEEMKAFQRFRVKLSFQELKGFVKDHVELKESMKYYFHIPGKELLDGLLFLNNDSVCLKMSDYICVGEVADVYVEYHGEEDSHGTRSGNDFEEDELVLLSDLELDRVISAEPVEDEHNVLVPDEIGVITQVLSNPMKEQTTITRIDAAAFSQSNMSSDGMHADSDTRHPSRIRVRIPTLNTCHIVRIVEKIPRLCNKKTCQKV